MTQATVVSSESCWSNTWSQQSENTNAISPGAAEQCRCWTCNSTQRHHLHRNRLNEAGGRVQRLRYCQICSTPITNLTLPIR